MFVNNQTVEELLSIGRIRYIPTYHTLAASTLALTNASTTVHIFTGTTAGQIIKIPDATTLQKSIKLEIYNEGTVPLQIQYADGTNYFILGQTSYAILMLTQNSTQNGVWFANQVFNNTATGIVNYTLTSSAIFSSTSGIYTLLTGLTVVPTAGRYAVWFSANGEHTTNNADLYCSIFKDSTQLTDSERVVQTVSSNFKLGMSTLTSVIVNGSESINVRVYRTPNGTLTITGRSLLLIRLGNE